MSQLREEGRGAYLQAGYQYARTKTVDHDAPVLVRSLVERICSIDCVSDIVHLSMRYMQPPVATFVVYGILDPILLDMRVNGSVLVTCDGVFDIFMKTFDIPCDREVEHFTCGLLSNVIDPAVLDPALRDNYEHMHRILRLMERVSLLSEETCDMMRNEELFRFLSRHVSKYELVSLLLRIVTNAKFYDDTRLTDSILRCSLARLSSSWINMNSQIAKDSLSFAETCLRENPAYRETMVHEMTDLWRTGWNPEFGRLLACQLDTTSVELVVRLEQKQKLCFLIRTCHYDTHSDEWWCMVRNHLRRLWPGRVCEVLQQPMDAVQSSVECPITHVSMRHPVVASDGNTYERDAIVRHLAQNGMWSPMTRGVVSYHLFPNRALVVT